MVEPRRWLGDGLAGSRVLQSNPRDQGFPGPLYVCAVPSQRLSRFPSI